MVIGSDGSLESLCAGGFLCLSQVGNCNVMTCLSRTKSLLEKEWFGWFARHRFLREELSFSESLSRQAVGYVRYSGMLYLRKGPR